ncbi:Acetylornithine deacetylase/Succinyl-diaminopimelate desuccinylase or related deacylase [Halalkaliarchaeum sp. AArc-CO]|uniref:M20 family metallopeptidase n=1 Tax=unclassified Halalkaliarchaeum TaxID=2678344 RepID=UPI00217ED8E2|nr:MULTISPECIES: M20 family metallopeptidase [unclassified Halalkaliarchaeum]MDR5673795.1 M20 family metallopeptidase [Halalkaliarchaeum sp. AArc-GB]UWG50993.1 Acetylornithine deacetylase/Succinyl-diaminopimelate desuccinylase or related deacylase [Halalkaliarchaeum sp. AArc-CO]
MNEHSPEFDPIAFLEDAVQRPSNESVEDVTALLVETIRSHTNPSVEVTTDDHGNTLARKQSGAPEAGPHLVFNTHLDTVSPHVPFERDRAGTGDDRSDVIRGRGACDAKGPLAALLAAFISARPETGRLTLAVTPDEETLSTGAAGLTGRLPGTDDTLAGDMYVVGEPTELDVCTAAKGRFQGTIDLDGVGAHAAEPESGVNAVAALEGALGAIRQFDEGSKSHPQLGSPSLVPTTVDGGESTNQVPASCHLVVDRRPIPPETAAEFEAALETAVRDAIPDDVGVSFDLTDRPSPFLESFATDPDHELVETLSKAAASTGDGGNVRPFAAATEASYFAPAPTVVFGPGSLADENGPVAHADREYVRVASVRQAATALSKTVEELLGHR